jgi:hypothetical protein
LGLELKVISTLHRPNTFRDWEDDASSINCFCVVDQSVEKRKRPELQLLGLDASNVVSCLCIVAMIVLSGVVIGDHATSNFWNNSE